MKSVAHPVEPEDRPKTQENKADYFIPKSQGGFHDGGYDMLKKLSADADCLALPHATIVTNRALLRAGYGVWPVNCR